MANIDKTVWVLMANSYDSGSQGDRFPVAAFDVEPNEDEIDAALLRHVDKANKLDAQVGGDLTELLTLEGFLDCYSVDLTEVEYVRL